MEICDFKDLPYVEGMPHGCAWGLFSKDKSTRDELGTLNLLTPERVQDAAKEEIRTGVRVQLDWSLNNVQFPGFRRAPFKQKIIDKSNPTSGHIGCDDEVSFNTQCGSQWDGFLHYAHRQSGKYYNGLTHDEIISGSHGLKNSISNFCSAGGIVGRGVLLDWLSWKMRRSSTSVPSPVSRHEIPLSELQAVAREQGVEFKVGDILLIRTGFVKWHEEAGEEERKKGTFENAVFIGVECTEESVEWFWNNHFAAVGGDTVAFEAWPPKVSPSLHEYFLALWGMPIGEMWNLEKLSKLCEEHKRWTFFLSSAPLNVPGGVGSTPNVVAIF
ncbi:hypothetical protein BT69DRAFT_1261540 [Atractiella rhizophila]|nr:hypothetical protein BT69DRAFT_1261540 [Atractiella rhizophila]